MKVWSGNDFDHFLFERPSRAVQSPPSFPWVVTTRMMWRDVVKIPVQRIELPKNHHWRWLSPCIDVICYVQSHYMEGGWNAGNNLSLLGDACAHNQFYVTIADCLVSFCVWSVISKHYAHLCCLNMTVFIHHKIISVYQISFEVMLIAWKRLHTCWFVWFPGNQSFSATAATTFVS